MNEKLGNISRRGFLALCGGGVLVALVGKRKPVEASSAFSTDGRRKYNVDDEALWDAVSRRMTSPLPRKYIWVTNPTGTTILAGEPVFYPLVTGNSLFWT